jgi:hypothetical protein
MSTQRSILSREDHGQRGTNRTSCQNACERSDVDQPVHIERTKDATLRLRFKHLERSSVEGLRIPVQISDDYARK